MLTDADKLQIRTIHQAIRQQLPGYQPRPSQNQLVADMAAILAGSFHSYDRIGLIEAGTGTGKSMAYLLDALPLALSRKKTLVISTATVALQEQLIGKDLPFFHRTSQLPFKYNLVKGRQRYACRVRLQQQLQQADFFSASEPELFHNMQQQLASGKWQGDRDSWPEAIEDRSWAAIVADAIHCPRQHPSHRQCPCQLARQACEDANVLVVNHAFLLAELATGTGVLPAPEDCMYVLDEAHHLPDVGREFFAAAARLDLPFDTELTRLTQLHAMLKPLLDAGDYKHVLQLLDQFQAVVGLMKPIQRELNASAAKEQRFVDAQLPSMWQRQADDLATLSGKCLSAVEKIITSVQDLPSASKLKPRELTKLQHELAHFQTFSQQYYELWSLWSEPAKVPAHQARWWSNTEHGLFCHGCPLQVNFQLDDLLFSQAHAVLLCSATLRTLNSFDYIKRELGLWHHEGLQERVAASPFAYQQRALLHIPSMRCDPTDEQFTSELIQVLPNFIQNGTGNLVLFASYWQMEQVAGALREQGMTLLVQGEASRQALLDLHRMKVDGGQTSILFGTQSFSEGLDLPGAYLTNLVITKIPFAVPTSPLEEAMAEAVQKRGGNPFLQLTVPTAARKLVQACGRLLRQEQDQGRVTLLDRRIVTKQYGAAMLNALPPFKRQID